MRHHPVVLVVVLLQIMRALSGMLREGVFHNRAKLYARAEVRDVLRLQHRAIHDAESLEGAWINEAGDAIARRGVNNVFQAMPSVDRELTRLLAMVENPRRSS